MDLHGKILPGAQATDFSPDMARRLYTHMIRIQALDDVFYNAQVNLFADISYFYSTLA